MCKEICKEQKRSSNTDNPECYAAWAEDEIRKVSSSGGVFTLLAEYILDKAGYVCGAAFGENWKVEHIIVDNKNDLAKLRGSKYVQSDIGYIYRNIKNLLDADKHVLFSGCPCQVAGLYAFLGKEYGNLITTDFICHGVPSYTIFKKWLDEEFSDKTIKHISFRDKEQNGWSCTTTTTTLADGTKINKQDYFDGFSQNLYLRKSCTECIFATTPRHSDITLADFWEVHEYDPSLDDRKGTSMVLTNSPKGRHVFDEIKCRFKEYRKIPLVVALNGPNMPLYRPSPVHPARGRFFNLIKTHSFKKSLDFALNDKYDIGIVGVGFGNNYGGILVNYALYEYIKSIGLTPLMIDKPRDMKNLYFSDNEYTNTTARTFMSKWHEVSRIYANKSEIRELCNKCELFLVGSDQVWNHSLYNPADYFVFLDFVRDDRKKISYASSFGHHDWYGFEHEKNRISYLLSKFDGVSVRENSAVDICKKRFRIEAVHVVDPVFLCPMESYDKLIQNSGANENSDFTVTYILDPNEDKRKLLLLASSKLRHKFVNLVDIYNPEYNANILNLDNTINECCPEDFLYYFKNSNFVITDSFHGVCFSILFKKDFICIASKNRGFARFISLLNMLELPDRMVAVEDINRRLDLFENKIDYEAVYKILDKKKKMSIEWLNGHIFCDKKEKTISAYDILDERIDNISHDLYNIITLLANENAILWRYYKYRFLLNFAVGKTRQRYKSKKDLYKHLILKIKVYKNRGLL